LFYFFVSFSREKEENLERRLELLTGELREILDIDGEFLGLEKKIGYVSAAIAFFYWDGLPLGRFFSAIIVPSHRFLTLFFLTHTRRNMRCLKKKRLIRTSARVAPRVIYCCDFSSFRCCI
jgi:hypothetical protein